MADQRNFRSIYVGKVVTIGVDEKKSLEGILNDRNVDITKLEQFCARSHVKASYRSYIWQLILGVLPVQQDAREFVLQQRRQQFDDSRQTLIVMQRITEQTAQSTAFLKMYLVENGRLPLCENKMFNAESNQAFLALAEGVSQVEQDPVLCYFLSIRLFSLQEKYRDQIIPMRLEVDTMLSKEDSQLHTHLQTTSGMNALPLTQWFKTLFAGTLPDSAFERICDIVIGESFLFLVCVTVSALIVLRRTLLGKNKTEDIVDYLKKFSDESSDAIVMKAAELWHKYSQTLAPACRRTNLNLLADKSYINEL